jgi:hypothetical protein
MIWNRIIVHSGYQVSSPLSQSGESLNDHTRSNRHGKKNNCAMPLLNSNHRLAIRCISPWVAMSLMQKAIRRGRKHLALRAAATLLRGSPERLWRRLGGIAFEDIGVGELQIVALVTAALAGKRFRSELGGEWTVASLLISRMSGATKC